MGIDSFEPSKYKMEYVPQRLAALEVCVHACYTVLNRTDDNAAPSRIDLGVSTLLFSDTSVLTGIAIDAGLVANRSLLNFVGIKLHDGGLVSESYALTVEKFSLPLVPLSTAKNILLPDIPASEMNNIWIESLRTASKSAAHFTENGAMILVARLGFACYATSLLVRKHFYQALNESEPNSIITPEVRPSLDGCWDYVDPMHGVRC